MTETPARLGRYEIVERIARGGMGVLYRGRDTVLDREVAIKVLSGDFLEDEQARTRFYREARAAARLQHRNIVTIFELGEEDATPYIVMEFLRGVDLGSRLRTGPPLALEEKIDIMAQVCQGLHYAHQQGVVHRDIKPANIRILDDGTVKILDFGIAKLGGSTLTNHSGLLGTAAYIAPELLSGGGADGRSDIFSAGIVLYELLAGRRPFIADTPTGVLFKIREEDAPAIETVAPDLPPALVTVVNKALQKQPADRYAQAGDMAADLLAIRATLMPAPEASALSHPEPPVLPPTPLTLRTPAENLLDEPAADMALTGRHLPATHASWGSRQLLLPALFGVLIAAAALVAFFAFRTEPAQVSAGSSSARPETPAATPEVPPPSSRTLRVVSEPPGAAIRVDGQDTGLVTPAEIEIPAGTTPLLSCVKPGFQPFEVRVAESEQAGGEVQARLVPLPEAEPGKVTLTGEYDFEIWQGNRRLAPAARSHTIEVRGRRTVRLKAPEVFLDRVMTVEASPGRQVALTAPALGRLTVRGRETCMVTINDREIDYPPTPWVALVAGTYQVTLTCPDGDVRRLTVTVAPGESRIETIR